MARTYVVLDDDPVPVAEGEADPRLLHVDDHRGVARLPNELGDQARNQLAGGRRLLQLVERFAAAFEDLLHLPGHG